MRFLQRAWRLAVLAYVVTSCGVDVVGVDPSPSGPSPCVFDDPGSHFESCLVAP